MMFAGTRHCPHCGAAGAAVRVGAEQKRACPHGHGALVEVEIANDRAEECPRCGGLWMPVATFDRLCSDAEAQTAAAGLALPPPVPADPHVRYLKCPECGTLMSRTMYVKHSGVITSICRAHGIWLERDQVREIIEFIRSGGLARAKMIEAEELDSKRRALEFERRLDRTPTRIDPDGE
jgi:Zn-finger nucleic acid-binding protein